MNILMKHFPRKGTQKIFNFYTSLKFKNIYPIDVNKSFDKCKFLRYEK